MSVSRRDVLKLAGGVTLAAAASRCAAGRPLARLLPSRVPLPDPFTTPLPRPPVLRAANASEGFDRVEMSVRPGFADILPGMRTPVWGYDGRFPGPIIEATVGRPLRLALRNELPVPIVTHLHGGRTPPDSDGFPTDLVAPLTGVREYVYPNAQRPATLWYHDHRMDFTGPQVWKGLVGFYLLRDADEARLNLPSGSNEIPLLLCDRSFDADGSFRYPAMSDGMMGMAALDPAFAGGVLGDVILVNGAPWPFVEVANTRYRLRILNASNARQYALALVPASTANPFVQIGSDGGLLEAPVPLPTITISPAERFDVILDFSPYAVGSTVTLENRAGSGTTSRVLQFRVVRRERDESAIPARLGAPGFPRPSEVVAHRVFDFAYARGERRWTINGRTFDANRADATPRLDTVERWLLRTDLSHPLHLHMVHMYVEGHSGRPGRFDAGWKDTLSLHAGETANVLIPFSGYRGRYVFHCHNLEHEDMGMMGVFEVI